MNANRSASLSAGIDQPNKDVPFDLDAALDALDNAEIISDSLRTAFEEAESSGILDELVDLESELAIADTLPVVGEYSAEDLRVSALFERLLQQIYDEFPTPPDDTGRRDRHRKIYRRVIRKFLDAVAYTRTPRADRRVPVAVIGAPPGLGKTHQAIQLILDQIGSIFLATSHDRARERLAEAQTRAVHFGSRSTPVHIQGIGRQCQIHSRDDWARRGYSFREINCDGCPLMQTCPSFRQFWSLKPTSAVISVHAMAPQMSGTPFIIDEHPTDPKTITVTIDRISRFTTHVNLRPELWSWYTPLAQPMRQIWDQLTHVLHTTPDATRFGGAVISAPIRQGGRAWKALDKLVRYIDATPTPTPDPALARLGVVTPENWIDQNVLRVLRRLHAWGSNPTLSADRLGIVMRVTAKGGRDDARDAVFELREAYIPPAGPHIILDADAEKKRDRYDQAYSNAYAVEFFLTGMRPKLKHVHATHYQTWAFARTRTINDYHLLTPHGVASYIRLFEEVEDIAARTEFGKSVPTFGLIAPKTALEACGFNFSAGSVQYSSPNQMPSLVMPQSEDLTDALQAMLQTAHFRISYHGGVLGSNEFEDCDALFVVGDQLGHLGVQTSDALYRGLDPDTYIQANAICALDQTINRIRPHLTESNRHKHIFLFSHHATSLGSTLTWHQAEWQTGRRRNRDRRDLENRLFRQAKTLGALPGSSVLARLQESCETRISLDNSISSMRGTCIINPDVPKDAEMYRRAAEAVRDAFGWHSFEFPNPLPARRPVKIHAPTREAAEALWREAVDAVSMQTPSEKTQATEQTAVAEQAAEVGQELGQLRDEITNEISALHDWYTRLRAYFMLIQWHRKEPAEAPMIDVDASPTPTAMSPADDEDQLYLNRQLWDMETDLPDKLETRFGTLKRAVAEVDSLEQLERDYRRQVRVLTAKWRPHRMRWRTPISG